MMRSIASIGILALAIAAPPASFASGAAGDQEQPHQVEQDLYQGRPVFWGSSFQGEAEWSDVLASRISEGPCAPDLCTQFALNLRHGGGELRVSLKTPGCDDRFVLELFDPSGAQAGIETSCYSADISVEDAPAGVWAARVSPYESDGANYQMRAASLVDEHGLQSDQAQLPNLRPDPPARFRLSLDSDPYEEVEHTPLRQSCTIDERVEQFDKPCLRMSVGSLNTGAGPLELTFKKGAELEPRVWQRIYAADGSTQRRDAGSARFHAAHQHYHFENFIGLRVYRVQRQRVLTPLTVQNKVGFCLADYRIAQWRRFDSPRRYLGRSACSSPEETVMGLSPGWGDTYTNGISGNFVPAPGRGLYLVTARVDPEGRIRESNERDNNSYSVIRIGQDRVVLLDRGYGTHPWLRQ